VGGGGLVAGITTTVKGMRPQARVVAVEPEGSPALRLALAAGQPVPVEHRSLADGLNAPFAGENCVRACRDRVESVLVSDDEIGAGRRFLYERATLACEPAGAAAAAALLTGKVAVAAGSAVVAVVSGGNVAPRTASAILSRDEG
jgi:threonine dehydratase